MWALYTHALAQAPSTLQANVLNTAANFVLAAVAGMLLFGEKLGGFWWVGAALLVAGTVIIGRRAGGEEPPHENPEVAKKED